MIETPNHHILYSFRRCPFAMRARLALNSAGISYELREVKLSDKPATMIELSPKATVPVLHRTDGSILEESSDIMIWALEQKDPEGWLSPEDGDEEDTGDLIDIVEDEFKPHLDRYKYSTRYEGVDPIFHRDKAEVILGRLEQRLNDQSLHYMMGSRPSMADMAMFTFIRQFVDTDPERFSTLPLPNLSRWYRSLVESTAFEEAMIRHDPWKPGDEPVYYLHMN